MPVRRRGEGEDAVGEGAGEGENAMGGADGGVGGGAVGVQHDDAAVVDDVVELAVIEPQSRPGCVQLVRNGESPAAVAQPDSSLRWAQTFSKAATYWSTSSGTSLVK